MEVFIASHVINSQYQLSPPSLQYAEELSQVGVRKVEPKKRRHCLYDKAWRAEWDQSCLLWPVVLMLERQHSSSHHFSSLIRSNASISFFVSSAGRLSSKRQ